MAEVANIRSFSLFMTNYDTHESVLGKELLAPPEAFLSFFEYRLEWLDTITKKISTSSLQNRAHFSYLEVLKSPLLTGTVFDSAKYAIEPRLKQHRLSLTKKFDIQRRKEGLDWTHSLWAIHWPAGQGSRMLQIC
jgi:hypothetical protein